jgi:glyoxylase-like metal-dependent hydrolase (beta-lactamase superfamily II)
MQLSENVHLVGSGQHGMRLTDRLDCNVWLLDGGAACAIVDAGGSAPERIIAEIEKTGIDPARIKYLLLTHAHGDHAGGARALHDHFGLEVICAREAAPWIEDGDMEATSLRLALAAGAPYPPGFHLAPCPVARAVDEGDTIRVGEIELQVLNTPGHSHGHISFLMNRKNGKALFSGDVIFNGGRVLIQNIWDCIIPEYAATMARLHELQIETLYPGHGPAILHQAHLDIANAHTVFSKLGIPRNLSG